MRSWSRGVPGPLWDVRVTLTALERRVTDVIERRRRELVALATDLIAFDTTARAEPNSPARDEAALQRYLGERLAAAGAEVDVWEPDPADVAGSPLAPPGLRFDGRPQLAARFRGAGDGRSLLLNGHVDVVAPTPRERWTSDPNRAEVRDGRLYGRGACDMKGGVAAMTLAAEALAGAGVALAGDLVVCTVTDEESTGAGGLAAVAHGVRADAGIVTEPSGFAVWVACRGSLIPTIVVAGRPGHAGVPQPHWRNGGPVNAIDKAQLVLDAMRRLQDDWHRRPDQQHPFLSPGDIVPVAIHAGEWAVSYPAACRVTYHVGYLPQFADAAGWGTDVRREIVECVERATSADPWLTANPPSFEWAPEVPPSEIPVAAPIVQTTLAAARALGLPAAPAGLDNWHDGATFTRLGGTPCVCFGPPDLGAAHTVDEHVPVDGLVRCAQALAVAAIRFCVPAG
jgi:acetylornithine deacetylase